MKRKNILLIGGVVLAIVLLVVGFWLARGGLRMEDKVGEEIDIVGRVTGLPEKAGGLAKIKVNLTLSDGSVAPVAVAIDFSREKVGWSSPEDISIGGAEPTAGQTVYKMVTYDEFANLVKVGDKLRLTFWFGKIPGEEQKCESGCRLMKRIASQSKNWLNSRLSGDAKAKIPDEVGLVEQVRRIR